MHNPSDECPTRFSQVKREYEHAERGVFWKEALTRFFSEISSFFVPPSPSFFGKSARKCVSGCVVSILRVVRYRYGAHTRLLGYLIPKVPWFSTPTNWRGF